jgi:hypothetical protein
MAELHLCVERQTQTVKGYDLLSNNCWSKTHVPLHMALQFRAHRSTAEPLRALECYADYVSSFLRRKRCERRQAYSLCVCLNWRTLSVYYLNGDRSWIKCWRHLARSQAWDPRIEINVNCEREQRSYWMLLYSWQDHNVTFWAWKCATEFRHSTPDHYVETVFAHQAQYNDEKERRAQRYSARDIDKAKAPWALVDRLSHIYRHVCELRG